MQPSILPAISSFDRTAGGYQRGFTRRSGELPSGCGIAAPMFTYPCGFTIPSSSTRLFYINTPQAVNIGPSAYAAVDDVSKRSLGNGGVAPFCPQTKEATALACRPICSSDATFRYAARPKLPAVTHDIHRCPAHTPVPRKHIPEQLTYTNNRPTQLSLLVSDRSQQFQPRNPTRPAQLLTRDAILWQLLSP